MTLASSLEASRSVASDAECGSRIASALTASLMCCLLGKRRMTDIVDSKRRSELMAGIRGRDTAPELAVRRIAHRMGLRFRLHRKDLPGRPDLVFPRHRLVVFVHGCFWHRHEGMPVRLHPQVPDRLLDGEVRGQRRPRRAPGSGP